MFYLDIYIKSLEYMQHIKLYENFDEDPNAEPEYDPVDKPETFILFVLSADGDFKGEVRDEDGKTICTVDESFIRDGIMQTESDLSGLRAYLVDKKKIREQDLLTQEGTQELGQEVKPNTGAETSTLQIRTI